jgi:prepilin-type N-terminal cleavage/methylation domain-containing protein
MNSKRNRRVLQDRSRSGFTLTEVMVASTIMMIFIAGFLSAFIMGMRTLDMSINHYRASAIARNRIQRARSFDYDSLTLLEESEARIDQYGNSDPNGTFRRSTSITTNTATAPHTIQIEVGVRFPTRVQPGLSDPIFMQNIIAVRM